MPGIHKTVSFARWIDTLRDLHGRARIQARIERLAHGNAGDSRPVGEGISELRIDAGPGYRVYYCMRSDHIVLLTGGDKQSQAADIRRALRIARTL